MDKKIEPRLLQGFRDLPPEQADKKLAILNCLEKIGRLFGYLPLETPALEYAEVLLGKYGQEGEKLIYKFKDLGEREIALRYDLTVSLARYVAANSRNLTKPFKRYQYGMAWRAEKPQKGRFREFGQVDFDIVGTNSYQAEAEIINLDYQILNSLGIDNFKILVNSRKFLNFVLNKFSLDTKSISRIFQIVDKLEKIGKDSILEELKQMGLKNEIISEIEKFISISGSNNQILDQLQKISDPNEVENLRKILITAKNYGVDEGKIIVDPSLARGLDYYTGFVIETKIVGAEEFGSIASGGRFDDLITMFSNEKLGSVGLSVGIDRLIEAMDAIGKLPQARIAKALVIYNEKTEPEALKIVSALRQEEIPVEVYLNSGDLSKKLKYADNKKIPYVLIIEDSELESNTIKLKNMTTGEQKDLKLEISEIIKALK